MRFAISIAAAIFLSVTMVARVWAWPGVHETQTKTYPLSAQGVVAVDDSSGDVTVTGWDSDRVEVTATKTAFSHDDLQRIETRADSTSDRLLLAGVLPNNCFNCDVSLDIHVPMRAHLTIATSSGDVTIHSFEGPARVDTSSGDVEVRDAGGEVHLHASSGDVKLDGIRGPLDAITSSGDIDASGLANDLNLVSSSGSVSAEFSHVNAVHSVRMVTSSGDIELTVPRGTGFKIEATTGSGSIDSNLALPIRERDSGSDAVAQVGDGKIAVQLRATSGDISVKMR